MKSSKPEPSPDIAVQEALRALGWALVLSVGILGVLVALFSGFALLNQGAVNPSLRSLMGVVFPIALGTAVGAFWGLTWLKRQWAKAPAQALKATPKKPSKNKPKRQR